MVTRYFAMVGSTVRYVTLCAAKEYSRTIGRVEIRNQNGAWIGTFINGTFHGGQI